jgi:large subunit ribosomal protein L29
VAAPETTELRAMSDEDLLTDLEETHQALFNLRFQTVTRQLADVSQVSSARRRIARIKTLLTERDILAEVDAMLAAEADGIDDAPAESDEAEESETAAADETDDGDDGDDEDGGS